ARRPDLGRTQRARRGALRRRAAAALFQGARRRTATSPPSAGGRSVSKRILIVEDEANIVVSLEFLLGQEGHQVKVATSGEEALELYPTFRPDLVLLDVMLPGIDGFEVCRRLRQQPTPPQPRI